MSNKWKIIIAGFGVVIGMILLIISAGFTENALISPMSSIVLITTSLILVFAAIFYAAKVDYETGIYKCRKCGYVFKPTFKAYILGAHSFATRRLKCPKCEEKSWCTRKMLQ